MEKLQLFRDDTILIKIEAHFEANQKDIDLLKHHNVLSKKPPAPHLRVVLDYLLDATTKEASKRVKLARAAMGNNNLGRSGLKKKFKKDKDPLKSLSAQSNARDPRKEERTEKMAVTTTSKKGKILNISTYLIQVLYRQRVS